MNRKDDHKRFERIRRDKNRSQVGKERAEIFPQRSLDEINALLRSIPPSTCPTDFQSVPSNFRKHPAHGVYVAPDKPTIVYATVCCKNRRPWLATDRHHEILLDIWQDTSHWVVGRYVLMPDHLHLLAGPQETAVEFDAWVQYFKSQFTKRNKRLECVWHTNHWDTRVRSAQHYEE